MKCWDFITLLGGAAGWPLVSLAQARPVVGFLSGRTASDSNEVVAAFRQGLAGRGYRNGENVTIEFGFANGHHEQLQAWTARALGLAMPGSLLARVDEVLE